MKKLLIYLTVALGVVSCGPTSELTYSPIVKPQAACRNVMTLFSIGATNFTMLDSAFYAKHLRNNFNKLDASQFRIRLEENLKQNLKGDETQITLSSDIYEVNKDYSFDEFKKIVDTSQLDAILYVNLVDIEYTKHESLSIEVKGLDFSDAGTRAHCSYHIYLYDVKEAKVVWKAIATVWGSSYSGFESISKELARNLKKGLSKDGYISSYSSLSETK